MYVLMHTLHVDHMMRQRRHACDDVVRAVPVSPEVKYGAAEPVRVCVHVPAMVGSACVHVLYCSVVLYVYVCT